MRRKRNMTTQERIDSARELIAEKQNELAELKKQLSELEAQKEQEDLKELYKIISDNGMSIEEAKELLAK